MVLPMNWDRHPLAGSQTQLARGFALHASNLAQQIEDQDMVIFHKPATYPGFRVSLKIIQPGLKWKFHHPAHLTFLQVLEGSGTFQIDREPRRWLLPGAVLLVEPDSTALIENPEQVDQHTPLKFLSTESPLPTPPFHLSLDERSVSQRQTQSLHPLFETRESPPKKKKP